MMGLVIGCLVILGLVCVGLQVLSHKTKLDTSIGNNPQFLKFQRGYFAVYLLAMFADWLQGPYLYKLYSYYGFQEEQIAILYVFGFASTVIIGMWAPLAADQFGRKRLCLSFTVLYSLSCFLKLSRSYGILIIGRIIGGVATSVLFSAFEAWYIHEHIETHDFPKEWIAVTFTKASMWNGVLAVMAGLITNGATEWFGPVAPYMLAVPFLIFAGVLIGTHWVENFSGSKVKFKKVCMDGFKVIMSKEIIFMVGVIEALFESVIYLVIFLWTPVLDRMNPHIGLGLVFSCFMICILSGQAIHQILSSRGFEVPILLLSSSIIGLIANIILVFSTNPANSRLDQSVGASFIAFLIFEFAVGLYFPSMGYLRSCIIPEQHRLSTTNWFRVPINLISCIMLLLLHDDAFAHGNRMIFVICSCLLLLCVLCGVRFFNLSKTEESLKQETLLMASEHIHNIF